MKKDTKTFLVTTVEGKNDITVSQLDSAIEEGKIGRYIKENNGNTNTLTIDSPDKKERIIVKKYTQHGYIEESIIRVKKLLPEERRDVVQKLHNDHLTQNDIAKKLNVSQATIHKDIKKLRTDKLIK